MGIISNFMQAKSFFTFHIYLYNNVYPKHYQGYKKDEFQRKQRLNLL